MREATMKKPVAVILRPGAAPAVRLPEPRRLPLALAPGFRLHEYRIERVLGQGGFGITYRARDIQLDREVAIKEYLPISLAMVVIVAAVLQFGGLAPR